MTQLAPHRGLHVELVAREHELSAIYEKVPGILFYVAIEPDGEFRFLSMSHAGLVATGLTREQFVGSLVRDVVPPPSRDMVLNHYREAIRSGRTVCWKEVSVYPAGRRVGEVAVTPLYDANGVATHLVGIVHDITERERLEEALHQREERLAFLLRLNDALRPLSDPVEMQDVTARLLGEYLRVNRVSYATIDGEEFIVTTSYDNSVPANRAWEPLITFGEALREACKGGESFAVSDVRTDARFTEAERANLFANDILALVGVMLHKEGRWLAAFCIHSATPRVWTQDEITLIEETAERMWSAAERARAEAALRVANQKLRESEARFSVIHDRAPFAISLTDRSDRSLVSVNEAFERMFEYSCDEVRGRTSSELGISTITSADALAEELQRHGTVRDYEVHRRTKSGAERTLLLSIDPVTIGEREFLLTTAIDITEKKRAEAALREREQRLRLALEASAAGSWTWDAGTNHVDWDAGFRLRYGFPRNEPATFHAWLSRVHEEDRQQVVALLDEILHTTTKDVWDQTFRIVWPDGTLVWIQSLGRAERDAEGKVVRLTGLELDVTARRQAENALQARRDEEHNRELRLLLETAAQGIVSVDGHGTIVTANRALEAMFGWGPGELIGQPIERLVPSSLRHAHVHHRTEYFAAPRPLSMGARLNLVGERKDGSTFPIEISLNHIATLGGGHAIAFVTDVTERHRAAAALSERTVELERRTAQLRQMASDLTLAEQHAREQLAKTLHDGLQQILAVASIDLEQLMNRDSQHGTPPALLVQAKGQLDEAIAAARSLSVELFPPVLQRSGLPAALRWLADWTRNKYGLKVQVSVDPLANSARKDVRTLLFESVRELLFNAVKHAQVDRVAVDLTREPGDMLGITVTDRGIGFDPAGLVDRAKTGQVGWGLFSIRERLALLGGRFEIESAPGRGTRFRLIAPAGTAQGSRGAEARVRQAVIRPSSPDVAGVASRRALRILIVDDHTAVREALGGLLRARPEFLIAGEAANGLEAVDQARALRPDAVLMDVSMPEMDGVEATRHIRAELPSIHILGLSMYPRTEDRHPIEQAGAERFFAKGVDTQRLIDHLLVLHRAITSGHSVSRPNAVASQP